jgi:hypothetical protein
MNDTLSFQDVWAVQSYVFASNARLALVLFVFTPFAAVLLNVLSQAVRGIHFRICLRLTFCP